MKTEVKTVEQWREQLDKDGKTNRGEWMTLSRRMHNSRAWAELSGSAKEVVLSMLDKLEYLPKKSKDKKGVRIGGKVLKNGGEFTLTTNELKVRGLKSSSTIAKAKRQAWELGFFDTVLTGTYHHAFEGKVSDRWEYYPDPRHRPPQGQEPPGKRLYGGFQNRKDNRKSSNLRAKNTRSSHSKTARRSSPRLRVKSARDSTQMSLELHAETTCN